MKTVRRALLSVTDKTGLAEFARGLAALGVELISTGGTAKALEAAGVAVRALGDFTGFPEMLDGRVKTLHPRVHGGILARRDLPDHLAQMATHGLDPIDLVVVNLYDFATAAARPDFSFEQVMEEIDIGGPTLLRAAAKNHASVIVASDPADYPQILAALQGAGVSAETRRALAHKVFAHTSRYDTMVADYFAGREGAIFSEAISPRFLKLQGLRYGENPHQQAAFYRDAGAVSGLAAAEVLQGKELSYNNILDLDAALGLAADLALLAADPVCIYIKHNNPCGAASGDTVQAAVTKARAVDPVSAFGGVVAVTRPVDAAGATVLVETFLEAVVAPDYTPEALDILSSKKNVRVLRLKGPWMPAVGQELRSVRGGLLVQSRDANIDFRSELAGARVVTQRAPTPDELAGLAFSWAVAKHVRSNAIVFGRADRVVAVGAGQMSRVDSVKICRLKAQEGLAGTSVASDAFFPFRDGVDVLAEAGATAIVQPGGSIRDEEVIQAANTHGLAMIFTGVRHFRH